MAPDWVKPGAEASYKIRVPSEFVKKFNLLYANSSYKVLSREGDKIELEYNPGYPEKNKIITITANATDVLGTFWMDTDFLKRLMRESSIKEIRVVQLSKDNFATLIRYYVFKGESNEIIDGKTWEVIEVDFVLEVDGKNYTSRKSVDKKSGLIVDFGTSGRGSIIKYNVHGIETTEKEYKDRFDDPVVRAVLGIEGAKKPTSGSESKQEFCPLPFILILATLVYRNKHFN